MHKSAQYDGLFPMHIYHIQYHTGKPMSEIFVHRVECDSIYAPFYSLSAVYIIMTDLITTEIGFIRTILEVCYSSMERMA